MALPRALQDLANWLSENGIDDVNDLVGTAHAGAEKVDRVAADVGVA